VTRTYDEWFQEEMARHPPLAPCEPETKAEARARKRERAHLALTGHRAHMTWLYEQAWLHPQHREHYIEMLQKAEDVLGKHVARAAEFKV
jgi:hypothetical protein